MLQGGCLNRGPLWARLPRHSHVQSPSRNYSDGRVFPGRLMLSLVVYHTISESVLLVSVLSAVGMHPQHAMIVCAL